MTSKQLPKLLREKRDYYLGDPNFVFSDEMLESFHDGYDRCYADMLPMVEMLVEALIAADGHIGDHSGDFTTLEDRENWDKTQSDIDSALSAWLEFIEEPKTAEYIIP